MRLALACSCLGKPFESRETRLALLEVQLARGYGSNFHGGVEWPLSATLALRGGYQTGSRRSLSAGLGLQVRSWRFDYAFVPFASGLGHAHRLSLYRRPAQAGPSAAGNL